jgi:hypothetical protein
MAALKVPPIQHVKNVSQNGKDNPFPVRGANINLKVDIPKTVNKLPHSIG